MSDASTGTSEEAPVMLLAQLLYESAPPKISAAEIRDRLAVAMPTAKLISKDDGGDTFLIAHQNYTFELKSGERVNPLTAIAAGNPVDHKNLEGALHQTWDWAEAREAVGRSRHQIIFTEMMARMFQPQVRVGIFHDVLLQVLELAPPLCVHCHHAERIVDPAKIVRASGGANSDERMAAFLNVRLFRVENRERPETVMDTRGLAALGLPDLQVHFAGLDVRRMAGFLYNSAMYIYANGDCIEDGHTIQGLDPEQRWRCQHEEALVGPKRVVIDIDPGDPFAAGKRRR